jgi:hypothetical protein
MKKLMWFLLPVILFCSTQMNIPESKHGESFYSESIEDGQDIMKEMHWELIKIDTIKQKGYRNVYLIHYIIK